MGRFFRSQLISFVSGFIFLVALGCSSGLYKTEIHTLKLLEKKTIRSQKQLQQINLDELRFLKTEIKSNIAFVNENEQLFIMDSTFIQHFGLYSATGKTISRLLRTDFEKLNKDLSSKVNKLNFLRYDLKHDLIPSDSVSFYYQNEIKGAKMLLAKTTSLNETIALQLNAYQITIEPMDRYINQVKNIIYLD